jgi:type VI secretion system protein ImpH
MDAEGRPETNSVVEAIRKSPFTHDFFVAVRMLEAAYPNKPRIGHSIKASDDPVRFCQKPSLRFEPSSVIEYRHQTADAPPRLFTAFLGLLGVNGPMPLHITEYVRDREIHHQDFTLSRAMDMYNHRLISLFYRAWRVNQQAVSFDRPENDRWSVYVASLIGIGMANLLDRDAVPDLAKLHYSGRLACHTKHAEGLRAILEDFFGVKTEIEQFIGQWLLLPKESQCRLGETRLTGIVGQTVIVGSRIWECQQKFRIRMGPMSFKDYQRLLPSGNSLQRLKDWVRNYIGDELGFEVQLVLKSNEVPQLRPGKVGQLGWSTWLSTKKFEKDVGDLVLQVA